jgi:hypothetical protein
MVLRPKKEVNIEGAAISSKFICSLFISSGQQRRLLEE